MSNHREWRKSSFSGAANACVELRITSGEAGVRDSKSPASGTLDITREAFAALLASVTA